MGRQLSCDGCCLGMAVCSPNLAEVENCLFPCGSFPGCLEAAGPPPSCKILDRSNAPHWPLLGALSQLCFVPRGHLHPRLTSLLWFPLWSVGAGSSPHRAARSPASFLRPSWHLDGLAEEGQKLWAPHPPDWCPKAWDSQRSPLPRHPHHVPLFPPGRQLQSSQPLGPSPLPWEM